MTKANDDAFARARQEKRLLFQQHWNSFVQSAHFLTAIILLSAAQGLFFLLSGSYIREFARQLSLIPEGTPLWSRLLMLAVQILVSIPGSLFCLGLWNVRRKTRWEGEHTPELSGLKLMQKVNFGVILVTGAALALYPTVIIQVGESFKKEDVYKIFYLFLISTILLIVSVTLIRLVLRGAEENISCCWSDGKYVLPLGLVYLTAVAAALIWAPLSSPFFIGVGLLAAAYLYVLLRYWLFLRKVGAAQAEIDRETIASRENPNDPYQRY